VFALTTTAQLLLVSTGLDHKVNFFDSHDAKNVMSLSAPQPLTAGTFLVRDCVLRVSVRYSNVPCVLRFDFVYGGACLLRAVRNGALLLLAPMVTMVAAAAAAVV
jgi:hypothetical protein